MPVDNSDSDIYARPDLATQLLQILITTTFNTLLCQKAQFKLQPCHTRWLFGQAFDYYPKNVKIKNTSLKCLSV